MTSDWYIKKHIYRGYLIAPESAVTCLVYSSGEQLLASLTSYTACMKYVDNLISKRTPMIYKNPTPVAVALIRVKSFGLDPCARAHMRLLMIERGIEPNIGGLAFPGGYVDELESAEDAVVREVFEEVGLVTMKDAWKILYTRTNANNRLLVFMLYDRFFWEEDVYRITKTVVPNEEIRAVSFADASATSCFSFHTEALQNSALWLPKPGELLQSA